MSGFEREMQSIARYYERRSALCEEKIHGPLDPCSALWRSELNFEVSQIVRRWLGDDRELSSSVIAEIGCGSGGNLLDMIRLGANPARLLANDYMPHLIEAARGRLPATVSFRIGNALEWDIAPASVDLVMQYTVFSSIQNAEMRGALAERMWDWLKPRGAILSYDFVFDNPRNPNVSKLTVSQLQALFPRHTAFHSQRVTLAPPIARRLAPISPGLCRALNALPFLRSHAVCLIVK